MAGADPFAFSMSSFGKLSPAVPEAAEQDDDPANDPFAADRGAAAAAPDEAPGAPDMLSGTLDPGAFGMGGMRGGMTGAAQAPAASSQLQPSSHGRIAATMERPSTPEPTEPPRPYGGEGTAHESGEPSSSGREWQPAHVPRARFAPQKTAQLLNSLDPFEPEPFEPLSTDDLVQLERLLRSLAGIPNPGVQFNCWPSLCVNTMKLPEVDTPIDAL
jgi:hypothetical protein